MNNYYQILILHSGNCKEIVQAVMGAKIGLNAKGSLPEGYENELRDLLIGAAGVAERPKTEDFVPPAHDSYWKIRKTIPDSLCLEDETVAKFTKDLT